MKQQPDTEIVHIIDDDPILRKTIELIFETMDIQCKSYDCAEDFLSTFTSNEMPYLKGCILSDIRMPGMGGLECQEALSTLHCSLPVIFMTGYADVEMAVDAMQKGAFDFVEKPFRHQRLIDSVHKAFVKNKEVIDTNRKEQSTYSLLQSLTKKESEVLSLLLKGLMNKQISDKLHMSIRTVETHRANILHKTETKNVTELAAIIGPEFNL